jgi:hypothetical protein
VRQITYKRIESADDGTLDVQHDILHFRSTITQEKVNKTNSKSADGKPS